MAHTQKATPALPELKRHSAPGADAVADVADGGDRWRQPWRGRRGGSGAFFRCALAILAAAHREATREQLYVILRTSGSLRFPWYGTPPARSAPPFRSFGPSPHTLTVPAVFGSHSRSVYRSLRSPLATVLLDLGRRPRPLRPAGFRGAGEGGARGAPSAAQSAVSVPRARVESAGARGRFG